MNFIPEQPKQPEEVPYFEDATQADGWQGQATTKGIDKLKEEIKTAINRLGGNITRFQKGTFHTGEDASITRDGFQILYTIEDMAGNLINCRLDVAALPVKKIYYSRRHAPESTRRDKSLRMALYMIIISLDGLRFLQKLSPGYAPLMPFVLMNEDKTISQLWAESSVMGRLLPPGESEFVDGDYQEIK